MRKDPEKIGKQVALGITLVILLTILMLGCLEPYTPPTTDVDTDILVVDGFLNTSEGSIVVQLTRTQPLSEDEKPLPVLGAQVSVEDNQGNAYALVAQDTGTYTLTDIPVVPSNQYRLKIKTASAEEFISDFVAIKDTPPIDSVTFALNDAGVAIRVNTHDPAGNTRYYRWDYVETWQYHAATVSEYKIVNKIPEYRLASEYIYNCYRTVSSRKIIIASTDKLAQDLVSEFTITTIPYGNSRLMTKYSTLVEQRAIGKEEYTFLRQLQSTTESVGGLFDPQPGQVIGNIQSINSSSLALGYFGVGNTTTKRFFLDAVKIPFGKRGKPIDEGCIFLDTLCVFPGAFLGCSLLVSELGGGETIAGPLYRGNTLVGYTLTTRTCADCRVFGGVTQLPVFWQ